MKNFFRTLFLSPAFLISEYIPGYAQDTLVRDLGEITISATRVEKKIADAGRSVTVISQEEISNGNYSSLAEILAQEEGIYITGAGQTPGSNESVFLRGANSNQTAIYIDGMRVTDASTVNNTIDLSELSVHEIERIEILRGAHSTLYGSAAIGGVINITTRKNELSGFRSQGGFSTGTFGPGTSLMNPFAQAAYKFQNGFQLSGFVDYTETSGLDATTDTITDPLEYNVRDKDNWKKLNSLFSFAYDREKTSTALSYSFTDIMTDIDKSAYVDDGNYVLNFKRSTLSGYIKQEIKHEINLTLSGGISWNQRNALNDSSIISHNQDYDHQYTEDKYSGKTSYVDFLLHRKWQKLDFLFGLSERSEEMTAENYLYAAFYSDPFPPLIYESKTSLDEPKPHTQTYSLYSQVDHQGSMLSEKIKNLSLVAGVRYDLNDLFREHVSFEINPSLKLGESALVYLSYSTGFNSPSLYQLYANSEYLPWDGSSSSGISLGNLSLKPEESSSAEIGFKKRFKDSGIFTVSVFNRRIQNQIEYAYMWNGEVPIDSLGSDFNRDDYRGDTYINIGTGNSYGVEFSILVQLLKHLSLQTGITLIDGEMTYAGSSELTENYPATHLQLYNNGQFLTSSKQKHVGLIRRPNTARVEFTYNGIQKTNLKLSANYVDERDDVFYDTQIKPQGALNTIAVEDYLLLDLNASYELGQHVVLSARIENLFNQEYAEIRGFSTRGRSIYFKVSYKI